MNKLKAVAFCFEGPIFNFDDISFDAWLVVTDEMFGVELTLDVLLNCYDEVPYNCARNILKKIKIKKNFQVNHQELLHAYKKFLTEKISERIAASEITPGIKQYLQQFRDRNIKIALYSFIPNFQKALKKTKLEDCFDFICDCSEEIVKGKIATSSFLNKLSDYFLCSYDEMIFYTSFSRNIKKLNEKEIFTVKITGWLKFVPKRDMNIKGAFEFKDFERKLIDETIFRYYIFSEKRKNELARTYTPRLKKIFKL